MKLLKYIPVILTCCLIIGILLETYFHIRTIYLTSILTLNFVFFLFSYFISNTQLKVGWYYYISVIFMFILIGMYSVNIQNSLNYKTHYSKYLKGNDSVLLKISKSLKSNRYYDKYEAIVLQINQNKTTGKVLVNTKKDSIKLAIGEIYYTQNTFKQINKSNNPHQFNYREYLKKQHIIHQITISNKRFKLTKSTEFSIFYTASKIRLQIQKNLKKHKFTKDQFGIINALLLGQRQDVSKELIQDYQKAGAVHILAVSGLHIGIIYGILFLLFLPFKRINFLFVTGKTIQLILVILFLWMYAVLAGLSASVVRSVTMFTAVALSLLSKRKTNTLHSLFISMFVLLLIHPKFLFDIGFQLSYLAVFSIVYWQPKFSTWYRPKNNILNFFWQIFTVSFAAQIGILPLSLFYFHQFPLLFFVSSLIIIPVLGVVLGFGFLVLCLTYFNVLPSYIALIYGEIIQKMNDFIQFIAKQEQFLIKNIFFSALLVFGFYFLIIAIYRFFEDKTGKKVQTVLIAILCIQLIYFYEKYKRQSKNEIIIFNQLKHSIIGIKKGDSLQIFNNLPKFSKNLILSNYQKGSGISKIKIYDSIPNIIQNNILIVDSLGVYLTKKLKAKTIVLRNSPKINMERLLQTHRPEIIIADASNYKSYMDYWKEICLKNNVKFYSTYTEGAYIIPK